MPGLVTEVRIGPGGVSCSGRGRAGAVSVTEERAEFALSIPHLPFYLSRDKWFALELVRFQEEFNRFSLRWPGRPAREKWWIYADDRPIGTTTGGELKRGLDLALLDGAPWSFQSRNLHEGVAEAMARQSRGWRGAWLDREDAKREGREQVFDAATERKRHGEECRRLRALADPRPYRLVLLRRDRMRGAGSTRSENTRR